MAKKNSHERMEKEQIGKAEGALKKMATAHQGYSKGGKVKKKK